MEQQFLREAELKFEKKARTKFGNSTTKHKFCLGNYFVYFNIFLDLQNILARTKTFPCLLWHHQVLWGADIHDEMLMQKISQQLNRLVTETSMDYHSIISLTKSRFAIEVVRNDLELWHKLVKKGNAYSNLGSSPALRVMLCGSK